MPIEITCIGCKGLLRLPDEYLGKPVRCGACGTVFTATPTPAPLPVNAPAPELPLWEDELPSLQDQQDIALRLSVLSDSTHQLWGRIPARLTHEGLLLGEDAERCVARPGECAANYRRANRIALEIGTRRIDIKISKPGVYTGRLARDLAELLNSKRGPIRLADYRIEWYVWLLAVIPFGLLVLMRGGALWGALAGVMASVSLLVAHHEQLSRPVRIGAMLGLGAATYALSFGLLLLFGWTWPWALSVDAKSWQRFAPRGEPFSVEVPGKAVKRPFDFHRVFLGSQPTLWGLELKAHDLDFTIVSAEATEGGPDNESRLTHGRNDLLVANENTQPQLIAERNVTVAGRPARDIEIGKGDEPTLRARLILHEDHIIGLLVVSSRLGSYRAEVDRFFDSVKLLPIVRLPEGVVPER